MNLKVMNDEMTWRYEDGVNEKNPRYARFVISSAHAILFNR